MVRLFQRQHARLVVASAAALLLPAWLMSGCSSAELGAEAEPTGSLGSSTGGTGGEDPSDAGESDESSTGDGDGDEDDGDPVVVEDPGPELGQCQPDAAALITHDLIDAQAELTPPLVRESVLGGAGQAGQVPLIPLAAQPFFNHFHFNYEPADGAELDVVGELWKPPMVSADAPQRYRLQYAVRAPAANGPQRSPVDLAIVVDLGPSMAGEPLALAAEALAAIDDALVLGDRVTLIAAGDQPQVLANAVLIADLGAEPLTGSLAGVSPAGAANIDDALALAYDTLTPAWDGQGQPRVVLLSNGHFQADAALLAEVQDQAIDGRYLASIALGEPSAVAAGPLAQLTAEGRGPLLYERDADDVWVDLQQRFAAHLVAAATELEVGLVLPPGLAVVERDALAPSGGEPRLALLGAGDQLIFHHELEACAELDPAAVIQVTVEWHDPATGEAKLLVWDQPVAELGFGSMDTRKGAATVAYVRALRAHRDGQASAKYGAVLDAISLIAEALETQPEDPDLIEMSQVLGTLEG